MIPGLAPFRVLRPAAVAAAIAAFRAEAGSRYLAGGTDLLVSLRRGLGQPPVLIDLAGIAELGVLGVSSQGTRIGSGVTLARLAASTEIHARYPAVAQAAAAIASPGLRNLATVGGNLLLETRCIYYNQSEWWRRANGYCLKHGGELCHVAPQGQRCHAAFSGDLAAALLALEAEIVIAADSGQRRVPLAALYADDGRAHLRLGPGEILTAVELPARTLASAYAKVRVRAATDFPLAGVAVALEAPNATLATLRIAVTGTNPRPFVLAGTDELLGAGLDDRALSKLGKLVQKQVQPMRTTLAAANYRRLAAAALVNRLARGLYYGSNPQLRQPQ